MGESELNISHWSNGNVRSEIPMCNGKIHGIAKEYYSNGNLRVQFPFVNGVVNGLFQRNFENGLLYCVVTYKGEGKNGIELEFCYSDK